MSKLKNFVLKFSKAIDIVPFEKYVEKDKSLFERFRVSFMVVAIYYLMFITPVPYLSKVSVSSNLLYMVTGSSIGSFATLGICPIITAYLASELMKKDAKIREFEEYKKLIDGWVVLLTVTSSFVYALLFRSDIKIYLLASITFIITGFFTYLLIKYDELNGSGIALSLIVFVSIMYYIFTGLFDVNTYGYPFPRGAIPKLITVLTKDIPGVNKFSLILESVSAIVGLVVGVVTGVYINSIRIRIAHDTIKELNTDNVEFFVTGNILEPRLIFMTTVPIIIGTSFVRLLWMLTGKIILLRTKYNISWNVHHFVLILAICMIISIIYCLLKGKSGKRDILSVVSYGVLPAVLYVFVVKMPPFVPLYLAKPVNIFRTSIDHAIVYYAVLFVISWVVVDVWLELQGLKVDVMAKVFNVTRKEDIRYQKWYYMFKYLPLLIATLIVSYVAILDLLGVPSGGGGVLVLTSIAVNLKDRIESLIAKEYGFMSVSRFILHVLINKEPVKGVSY